MANLTADFNSYITNQRAQSKRTIQGGHIAYIGGLAQLDATGNYVNAAASGTTRKIVGQFVKAVASGLTVDVDVPVREGDILLDIGAAPACGASNIGAQVYADTDHSVNMDSNNAKAGILIALQDSGALVRCTLECTL